MLVLKSPLAGGLWLLVLKSPLAGGLWLLVLARKGHPRMCER